MVTSMFDDDSKVAEIFRKVLNRHGYGFQYRVMQEAQSLFEAARSRWVFEVAEFPVAVRGRDTHIHFILRHGDRSMYMIAECKRVNPALSNWCFARAPFTRRNRSTDKLFFAHAMIDGNASLAVGISQESSEKIYHFPFEMPSRSKGEEHGKPRGELDKGL